MPADADSGGDGSITVFSAGLDDATAALEGGEGRGKEGGDGAEGRDVAVAPPLSILPLPPLPMAVEVAAVVGGVLACTGFESRTREEKEEPVDGELA